MKFEKIKKNTAKLSDRDIRKMRVRFKLKSVNYGKFRFSIFKSRKNIEVQIIDDINRTTLCSASSLQKDCNGNNKIELSQSVGSKIASFVIEKKIPIDKIYYDRGGYKYHGRIAVLVESFKKSLSYRSSDEV